MMDDVHGKKNECLHADFEVKFHMKKSPSFIS